ncbi:MAG: hypothetical protein DSM107014_16025 [Gomphosphaeria aponina SAG 52.96 = DSM 107014]|uniref:Uncharacterized protein n=1 Tax=Gomphosphaeria aponina SAG 52.96 = DSM 107014 TaxID=1521640 RepID=A0A941GWQ7_9CHRO|nr:hypothetical protein [Gomphosphaeria aponina SAG 52.96 = DSM 107014]
MAIRKTLIITVGTRQIGWKCKDGIIRCFGTDGGRNEPKHTDELYQELGVTRGHEQEGDRTYPWGVRDLGEKYFEYCQEWLGEDFSKVQLLMDEKIIQDHTDLNHIILWGTNQPETVSWSYRRSDTLWLAKLMEKKIKATFPKLKVDVFDPQIPLNNLSDIREELEEFILEFALENIKTDDEFTLMIENKGSTPTISESISICAAGLVRQYNIINIVPEQPEPSYEVNTSSRFAETYKTTAIVEYFWPLEKLRVISAWERGDFEEARIWLASHQTKHEVIYKLAKWLSLSINGEINKYFITKIGQWINSKAVKKLAEPEKITDWQQKLQAIKENQYAKTWETFFLFETLFQRKNYTTAFIIFAQTLERLLYLEWQSIQYDDNSNFESLINEWCEVNGENNSKFRDLLHKIRTLRNKVIHKAKPVTEKDLSDLRISIQNSLTVTDDNKESIKGFKAVLEKICKKNYETPPETLMRSLANWGLSVLNNS